MAHNSDQTLILKCGIQPLASEKHQYIQKETEYLINSCTKRNVFWIFINFNSKNLNMKQIQLSLGGMKSFNSFKRDTLNFKLLNLEKKKTIQCFMKRVFSLMTWPLFLLCLPLKCTANICGFKKKKTTYISFLKMLLWREKKTIQKKIKIRGQSNIQRKTTQVQISSYSSRF